MWCLILVFSTYWQCMFYSEFSTEFCEPQEKFRPIWAIVDCGICSEETHPDVNRIYTDRKQCNIKEEE